MPSRSFLNRFEARRKKKSDDVLECRELFRTPDDENDDDEFVMEVAWMGGSVFA